ncbi:MAG TPA: GIY-YIG nuclease family protein [Fimbriiglobus sp.]|nr:GIY-YIG nuclease family protein [Fimbriiglobus sp.]
MPPAQDGLFAAEPFTGFGLSRFRPAGEVPVGHHVRGRSQAALGREMKAHAPKLPGVYGMLDARGRLVYVGKAKSLRARLLSYFRTESRDPKAGRIIARTRTLLWEEANDEFAALLRELELIRRHRPRFNVLGQPGPRRYVYLCLGKAPAPYAYLTRDPTGKEVARYGPLVGRDRADDAVRRLNDWFKLRDCPTTVPMAFADQPELFPDGDRSAKCLRFDIANCLGPCGGLCTRKEYAANVRAARAFLDGRDRTLLKELTQRMMAAASELRFEQAMALRDRLQLLAWLDDRLRFLRTARQGGSFVYPLTGPAGGTVWYLIHHGEVRAALREPVCPATVTAAAALIGQVFADPGGGAVTDHTVDSVLLVTGWFKRYAAEKAKLITRAAALAFAPAARPAGDTTFPLAPPRRTG